MDFLLAVLIIAAAVAVAVAAMLLVRRRAPDGSYFSDGDRASGVFGALATGFSLLLGLLVFVAFSSYDDSKTGAEAEALAVVQQFETAQFLPPAARGKLSGELICYGRSVIRSGRGCRPAPRPAPSTPGPWPCSGPCRPSSRRPRPSSRPTTSGST